MALKRQGGSPLARSKNLRGKLQDSLDTSLYHVKRKGNERLTIMIIPHWHEKIFSLQLNWLMITFLVGTILAAVALSGYGVYLNRLQAQKTEQLKLLYGANYKLLIGLQSTLREMRDIREELIEKLKDVAEQTGIPENEMDILPDSKDAKNRAERLLFKEVLDNVHLGPGSNYLPPVYSIRASAFFLYDQSPLLSALKETLRNGIGVYSAMPLGRPVHMDGSVRDTSGYGVRSDPFSGYGAELHTGYDMSGPDGTPVYATALGSVHTVLNWDPGYGNVVILRHENGYYALFAHLSAIRVSPGQSVYKGQLIGHMGRTGRATGTHLHYEVWLGDSIRIDPLPYICALDFQSDSCREYMRLNGR